MSHLQRSDEGEGERGGGLFNDSGRKGRQREGKDKSAECVVGVYICKRRKKKERKGKIFHSIHAVILFTISEGGKSSSGKPPSQLISNFPLQEGGGVRKERGML